MPDNKGNSQHCSESKIVNFSLDVLQTQLYKDGAFDVFEITNAKVSGKEGYPTTYSISQNAILENNIEICDVVLFKGNYVEIQHAVF